jgi:hypothetical protein
MRARSVLCATVALAALTADSGAQWSVQAKCQPDIGAARAGFGSSVAISGSTAVIGSPEEYSFRGCAYVFELTASGWSKAQKLLAADGDGGDLFGSSVAISNSRIIVGAYGDSEYGYDSGAAYVFEHDGSTWQEVAKLLPSDGARNDWFGSRVGISGSMAVVGAPGDDDCGYDSGSVYAFEHDGSQWQQVAKFLPGAGSLAASSAAA